MAQSESRLEFQKVNKVVAENDIGCVVMANSLTVEDRKKIISPWVPVEAAQFSSFLHVKSGK